MNTDAEFKMYDEIVTLTQEVLSLKSQLAETIQKDKIQDSIDNLYSQININNSQKINSNFFNASFCIKLEKLIK